MRKRMLFILCLVFAVGNVAFGQIKTITNADLEKFKQKRLAAEKEYLENYERLGLPSPVELERRRKESERELSELSARLEQEQLQRQIYAQQQQPIYIIQNVTVNQRRTNRPLFYNYAPYGFYYFRRQNLSNQGSKSIIIRQLQPIRQPVFVQNNMNIRQ